MPFSRITTNFYFENESVFIESFHKIMIDVLKIPDNDRLLVLDQKTNGFYQPTDYSGKYIVFEISLFSGRTIETKRKLFNTLIELANSCSDEGCRANVILNEVEKENWGVERGQPASEIDLGFNTNV